MEVIAKKLSLPQVVIKYYNIIKRRYSFKVAIIYTDKETALKNNFKEYIAKQGITFKILLPYTQLQNSSIECFRRVIIEKS